MKILFVEGVPGVGKSTISEKICSLLTKQGHVARWYLEESHDNPLHPKTWRNPITPDSHIEECLSQWSKFVEVWADKDTTHIFDGSAFQSTVRFMMERRLDGIDRYFRRFEEIVIPFNPQILYFRPDDVGNHSKYVCDLRGDEWAKKVSEYLARTDYSKQFGLSGFEGMYRFWREYAELCDSLVTQTIIPAKTIKFAKEDWSRHMDEAAHFLAIENVAV